MNAALQRRLVILGYANRALGKELALDSPGSNKDGSM
jgi:hypothetical protein